VESLVTTNGMSVTDNYIKMKEPDTRVLKIHDSVTIGLECTVCGYNLCK